MKRALILMVLVIFAFAMASCDKKKIKKDDEIVVDDDIIDTSDDLEESDGEDVDDENADKEEPDEGGKEPAEKDKEEPDIDDLDEPDDGDEVDDDIETDDDIEIDEDGETDDDAEDNDDDGISSKMVPCDKTGVEVPVNATLVEIDVEILWVDGIWTAPAKCGWTCDTDYFKEDDTCINEKTVNCLENIAKPANSHDVPSTHSITYTTDGGWSEIPLCDWTCSEGFDEDSGNCINEKIVPCDATGVSVPQNGHIVDDATVTITFNGTAWSSPAKCVWVCDIDYYKEGETCINQKEVECLENPDKPENSHDTIAMHTVHYTTADGWEEPPVCNWECDEDYLLEEGACINSKMVDCIDNAPNNATSEVVKVKILWFGSYWSTPDYCDWTCNEDYHTEDDVTCVENTKMEYCNDVAPNNASSNFVEVEIEWVEGNWTNPEDCEWACDSCYMLNESKDSCVFQQVVFVNQEAEGDNDGTSWENAKTNFSDAIENLESCDGQEIWVAKGTYKPDRCFSIYLDCNSRRNHHFTMKKGVSMYGGFAGTEIALGQRDLLNNETILSGDFDGDDTWDETNKVWLNRDDNAYNVVVIYSENINDPNAIGSETVFDGFTIVGGASEKNDNEYERRGGGLNLMNHAPAVKNCKFIGNSGESGGVIYGVPAKTEIIIENSSFYRNIAANRGGAIDLTVESGPDIKLTLSDSRFEENFAVDGGGAAIYLNKIDLFIENSTFKDNIGKTDGALQIREADLSINSSTFARNKAISEENSNGGAIDFNTLNNPHILTISGTEFENNFATEGAAISVLGENSQIEISDSSFKNHDKGALPKYRQIINAEKSTLTIVNSIFENNSFGAVKVKKSNLVIESSSFIGNGDLDGRSAIEADQTNVAITGTSFIENKGSAGALYMSGVNNQIYNSVFWGNEAGDLGAVVSAGGKTDIVNCSFSDNINFGGLTSAPIVLAQAEVNIKNSVIRDEIFSIDQIPDDDGLMVFDPSIINIQNSNVINTIISGLWNPTCASHSNCINLGNNIDTNPLFVGSGDDPLMLQTGSPCINTGDNTLIPFGITTDILGNDRIMGTSVDMGAYEFVE
ncbi:MAG: choice-of-anchor Q domain-containing protein [bacterium]